MLPRQTAVTPLLSEPFHSSAVKCILTIGSVLVFSSPSPSPGTPPSSLTRRKPQHSVASWKASWVLTLNTGPASNALPSIVHGSRQPPLPHDRTFARAASRSTVTTKQAHLQRAR